jgi:hypothetical protein
VSDIRARLQERLAVGGEPPAVLERLDDREAAQLLELYEHASERQRTGLQASMEAVLSHAPRMLRGRLQKALFPGGAR